LRESFGQILSDADVFRVWIGGEKAVVEELVDEKI
jgi:hypothetical protein